MVFVGFSTPRRWNPLSALIRAMMRSQASHAWLLVEDPLFELRLVLEAHSTGFRLIALAEFVKENRVVALVEPAHDLHRGLPEAGGWLGDQFDVLGLFGIFLTLVGRWFSARRWRNPFTSSRALFCSEAVVRVMKASRYPGAERLGNETTTPAELLAFLEADLGSRVISGERLNLWRHLRATGPRRARRKPAAPAGLAA
ncbi:MAG: hypothetical protein IPO09_22315 [Anaeromyxobacter sp.]|nr:hypothetical protein [Anaeromyxobacter sp.]MBL0274504.1 hypothetical protein [Anaeromyxobacter sp.]